MFITCRYIILSLKILILLLGKFVEKDPALPENSSFLNTKKEFYSSHEIANAEFTCLKLLRYKLNSLSAYSVLKYFLTNGIVFTNNINHINQLYTTSFEILKRVINDSRRLIFSNLQIALSCLFIASIMIGNRLTEDIMKVLLFVYDCKFDYFSKACFQVYK